MSKQTIKALVGALQMEIFDANERNQDKIVSLSMVHGHQYFMVVQMDADEGEGQIRFGDEYLVPLTVANLLAAIKWVNTL